MFKKKYNQLGFTLIELMVVVAIIGILMSAGIVAFRNAQQTSRDAKRKADVNAIAKAYEQFYAQSSNYLYPTNAGAVDSATYFPNGTRPVDPQTGNGYPITVNATLTDFCVCARLENTDRGNATSQGAAGVCAYGAGAGANWFCASGTQ